MLAKRVDTIPESDPSVFEPKLTVEAAYQHMQGDRFRHMAGFRRWRLDKRPGDCTFAQLEWYRRRN